jgi:hypothetical protein
MKTFTPRPYQNLIINHLLDIKRSNVWAGMGMGKTAATLTALENLYLSGSETKPTLVLAPLRVAQSTWPDEALKWNHLRNIEVQPVIGTAKARMAALKNTHASVFTVNYDNLVWLVDILGDSWPFGTIIADESTRLKSFRLRKGGKRTAALAKIAHKSVHRWVNLTGTPSPNGLMDLWGQAWFVDQGERLGRTHNAFTSRWFNRIQFPGQQWSKFEPLGFAHLQIQLALSDVTLSLNPSDWFDIEKPIHNVINVELPPKARAHYQAMEKELFLKLGDSAIEALNAAAKTIKCLQMCIAENSEILTNNGWKPIQTVTSDDLLWDGIAWVTHGGVINMGIKPVVTCWGARMTPDHKVLTDKGWKKAEDIINAQPHKGFNRSNFWLPDDYQTSWKHDNKKKTRYLAGKMYMWERSNSDRSKSHEYKPYTPEILRMSKRRSASKNSRFSRDDITSNLEYVAPNALSLREPSQQRLEKLWRQGNNCLPTLAKVFRKLFRGYGAFMVPRSKSGSDRQFKGLFSRKLPVGYSTDAKQKSTYKCDYQHSQRSHDGNRSCGNFRDKNKYASRKNIQIQIFNKESLTPTHTAKVFDITNAGPRNRFVMRGTEEPFIAHNCSGAIYSDDNHNWTVIHDAKIQALESIVNEAGGMPVLVAYHWKHDLERLLNAFPKGKMLDASPQTLTDWNNGKIPLLFAHPASCGHGLNLQDGGNILVFFSHWWDLEQYQQIIERIGPTRQAQAGHNRPVFIHHIVAKDTLDEVVMKRRNSKRAIQDLLLEAMKRK